MKEYFICAYYDDANNYIGVFKKEIPKEFLNEISKEYDIVEFE